MTQCEKCLGHGIIGSGPEPWLQLGAKRTCDECAGTGQKTETEDIQNTNISTDAPITVPAVDNSDPKEGSSEGSGAASGGESTAPQNDTAPVL